jgi:spermidine synthase
MGTVAVLLSVAAILLAMALLFGSRSLLPFLWAGVVGASFLAMAGPFEQARVVGERLGLRPSHGNWVHFHEETQYSTITVEDEDDLPGVRSMTLDFLIHAYVNLADPEELVYEYEQVYAAVTRAAVQDWPEGRRLRALSLGGGGFVFPRWLLGQWPDSYLEVAEIDPAVTRAAYDAFGLPRETPIRVFDLDARNHVEDLLRQADNGVASAEFDFVYSDAFNHYSPPFHLTTKEFNDKLRRLMAPDGVLLANVIDVYRSGRFIGAMINTLEASFPHVYAISSSLAGPADDDGRDTFIVVASGKPLDLGDLVTGVGSGMVLDPEQLATLRRRSDGFVLTDDFAPVDNMLAPVIRMADKQ